MKQICLVLVLSLTGCSFFMTRGPNDTSKPPRAYPSCTTSMTYPIVDGVLTALFLASMTSAIAADDESDFTNDETSRESRIASAAVLAGVAGVSAFIGYSRVSKCRAAHESFAAAYPNGMMPYGATPYGYQQPAYPQQGYAPAPNQQPQPSPQGVPQPSPYGVPQPYPGQAPAAAPMPAPAPAPTPAAAALGTEGDVCASNAECATGLACTSNVCVRPPSSPRQ